MTDQFSYDLSSHPLFAALPDDALDRVGDLAETRSLRAGETLCYEGDTFETLTLLVSGAITLSHGGQPRGALSPGDLLDPAAALGARPASVKAEADVDCALLCWPVSDLLAMAGVKTAARGYLADLLQKTERRLSDIAAPVHYRPPGSAVAPGPFRFDNVRLLIAFCEADVNPLAATLPPDVTLLSEKDGRAPLFVGFADFPSAYPEDKPEDVFRYAETSVFLPVRHRATPGVFLPFVYPSTWEPILIGREVYGFRKRLGDTRFAVDRVTLSVDGREQMQLRWRGQEASSENALVGALMDWLGLSRTLSRAAFAISEGIRAAAGIPARRRVDVFNHKRIPAVDATPDEPTACVNQLTQAVFGVLKWYSVSQLTNPVLTVSGGPLRDANLTLIDAYRTRLDMRLSAGKSVRDYPAD